MFHKISDKEEPTDFYNDLDDSGVTDEDLILVSDLLEDGSVKFSTVLNDVWDVVKKRVKNMTDGTIIGLADGGINGEPTCGGFKLFVEYIHQNIPRISNQPIVLIDFGSGLGTTSLSCFSFMCEYHLIGFEFNIPRLVMSKQVQQYFMQENNDVKEICQHLSKLRPGVSNEETEKNVMRQASSVQFFYNNSVKDIIEIFMKNPHLRKSVQFIYFFCNGWSENDIMEIATLLNPDFFPNLHFLLTSSSFNIAKDKCGWKFLNVLSGKVDLKDSSPRSQLELKLYRIRSDFASFEGIQEDIFDVVPLPVDYSSSAYDSMKVSSSSSSSTLEFSTHESIQKEIEELNLLHLQNLQLPSIKLQDEQAKDPFWQTRKARKARASRGTSKSKPRSVHKEVTIIQNILPSKLQRNINEVSNIFCLFVCLLILYIRLLYDMILHHDIA